MTKNKLLVIASDFPPLVGTNTQRIISFVRHLAHCGWKTTVVTRALADLETIDSRDYSTIPATADIVRIEDPDLFAKRRRNTGVGPSDMGQERLPQSPESSGNPIAEVQLQWSTTALQRLPREVASRAVKTWLRYRSYHPDTLRPWADAAARAVIDLDIPRTHDVLLTSAPSYSGHVSGLTIKRGTGLPWVADFRDLWVGRPFREPVSQLHAWMDQRLEAAVVRECDVLLLASPAWVATFVQRYGAEIESKIVVLTNGYDAEETDAVRASLGETDHSIRRFVLTGSMHAAESPLQFIHALGALRRHSPDLAAQVRADFIGNGGENTALLNAASRDEGVSDLIQLHGPRSHVACVRAQFEADFLFMALAPEHRDTISGKSFEYMATGKPVLACLAEDSIQARLLGEARTMRRVDFGDVQATESAIRHLLATDNADLTPNWQVIREYERGALTRRLAAVLDRLAAQGSRSTPA
ncbi:glycosyltransferase [Thauera phenylacetica]|uniref:glycosyltransferase n=1 Tax=Thauera phenylacetica TaxID=164400 RepID=UPI0039E622B3